MKRAWTRLMFKLARRLNTRGATKRERLERSFIDLNYSLRITKGTLDVFENRLKALESEVLGKDRILH